MEFNTAVALWIAVGLVYTLINGLFRKNVNTEGDPLLVMAWILLGPICVGTLFGRILYRKFKK